MAVGDQTVKLDAVLFICDKPNKNGRIYSRELANRIVERFHDMPGLCGQVGMPEDGKFLLNNISHVVRELKVTEVGEDWGLVATIETLPLAEKGLTLAKLLEDDDTRKLYTLRTAGTGTLTEMPDGTVRINNDYVLESVNLVPAKDAA